MWQPSASIETLRRRSEVISTIRQFFAERNVMEVETPCLSHHTVTDQHLVSFATELVGPGFAKGKAMYLQTSPEYAMKRLLAANSGCIFQLSKAFRNEEVGRFHNPEFTMLEWYRVGFDHFALMDEIDALMQLILGSGKAKRMSYQQAFLTYLDCDPLEVSDSELEALMLTCGFADIVEIDKDRDTWLQLLFSTQIEPEIGLDEPCFIYHYPASQAALAKISQQDARVAERFELYYRGIELANGFHELTDANEQLQRFKGDNVKRERLGLVQNNIDPHFLAALNAGLPNCAGVALGIDRLLMLALEKQSLAEVISFDLERA